MRICSCLCSEWKENTGENLCFGFNNYVIYQTPGTEGSVIRILMHLEVGWQNEAQF